MDEQPTIAICEAMRHRKSSLCSMKVYKEGRCKLHYNSMMAIGPKEMRRRELDMKYKNEIAYLYERGRDGDMDAARQIELARVNWRFDYQDLIRELDRTPNTTEDLNYKYKLKNGFRSFK